MTLLSLPNSESPADQADRGVNPFTAFGYSVPVWKWLIGLRGEIVTRKGDGAVTRKPFTITYRDAYALGLLATYRGKKDGGECRPGIERLAEDMGTDERDVKRILRRLEAVGVLVQHRRGGKRSAVYSFHDRRSNPAPLALLPARPKAALEVVQHTTQDVANDVTIGMVQRTPLEVVQRTTPAPRLGGAVHHPSRSQGVDPPSRSSERERAPARAPARRDKPWRVFPSGYEPTEEHRALAAKLGVNIETELLVIRNHEFDPPRRDPGMTLTKWIARAATFGSKRNSTTGAPRRGLVLPSTSYEGDDDSALLLGTKAEARS